MRDMGTMEARGRVGFGGTDGDLDRRKFRSAAVCSSGRGGRHQILQQQVSRGVGSHLRGQMSDRFGSGCSGGFSGSLVTMGVEGASENMRGGQGHAARQKMQEQRFLISTSACGRSFF